MNTLGERIKQLRGKNTQIWLAKQLSIPPTTLSNYENGKSELNFAMIEAITTIFKVNTDWLLFGRGPMRREEACAVSRAQASEPGRETCARCAKLEEKLDRVERQRDALMEENRQLWKKAEALQAEMGELKARLARLEGQAAASECNGLSARG